MLYRKKNQIVRLSIFCTMCICISFLSATVISDNHDSHTEETLAFHIQRPPDDVWDHSSEAKDISADVGHTHPAQTHTHENWWVDPDENGEFPEFSEHMHAAYTHGSHNKAHYRPPAIAHTPHNSDETHRHDTRGEHLWPNDRISHVHGGRAHTHFSYVHTHGNSQRFHEDHDTDGEHTHPPMIVENPISGNAYALPLILYRGLNGYTHTHPDPAFEAHKAENPPHTDHTSYVEHSHDEVTHTHDDFSEHTHAEHSHTHANDIAEFGTHKQERQTHTPHKSFIEHTHSAQTHSHGEYPSHTHNGYSHSHADDIAELETHKQERQTHTPTRVLWNIRIVERRICTANIQVIPIKAIRILTLMTSLS